MGWPLAQYRIEVNCTDQVETGAAYQRSEKDLQ